MEEIFLYFNNKKMLLEEGRKYVIGRAPGCDAVIDDKFVSRRHAALELSGGSVLLSDLGSVNGTWYEGERIREVELKSNSSFRIANNNLSIRTSSENDDRKRAEAGDTMLFEKQLAAILEGSDDPELERGVGVLRRLYNKKKEGLSELASRDGLTGLRNRRHFDEKIAEEVSRAARYGRDLSLLMIDIDRFKAVNDRYGHQKGDEALAAVAGIIRASLRSTDIVCRYGGEEIAVLLPETGLDDAARIAELCRSKLEAGTPKPLGFGVTVSIGVSALAEGDTPELLVKAADGALYAAKEGGRNRVASSHGIIGPL